VTRDADTRAIERRLTDALGLKVELKPRKGGAGESCCITARSTSSTT